MDNIAKQEFHLRDLETKSVTLFPSRAQIVRQIKDLQLTVSSTLTSILTLSQPHLRFSPIYLLLRL